MPYYIHFGPASSVVYYEVLIQLNFSQPSESKRVLSALREGRQTVVIANHISRLRRERLLEGVRLNWTCRVL